LTPKEVLESKEIQQGMIDTVCMLGRLGEPNDIAYGAVYLASDESSWMTAHDLVIDGGVHISN
ncbi:MAG: SDR family oxidoreductase, partial [Eggerthellaceae bacterium]|nr:SDR family oxidoreductase [Eggerthellaceae bacterium]